MSETKKKKRSMPHLMLVILILLLVMSLLTYIVPAGQFATDPETGKLIGTEFSYLGYQTPVNPWQALCLIMQGIVNSGKIIATLFAMGGVTQIALGSKAIDHCIDAAIYKLQDKGVDVLIPVLSLVFCVFGCFAAGDYIIAMVPIGLMIARKLKLDPLIGFSLIIVTMMMACASSPTQVMLPQLMMDVPIYSGFGLRMVMEIPIWIITTLYIWRYARKVHKDPHNSVLPVEDWYNDLEQQEGSVVAETRLDARSIWITVLYFVQPIVVVFFTTKLGYGQEVLPAICIINSFVMGWIAGWNGNKICSEFAKGVSGMAFVCLIIGIANSMSLVMSQGNILHTIVYTFCLPLRNVGAGLAAIGISVVVTLINLLIPSASAKVAILCPIIQPMCDALSIPMQIGVSAFKFGDAVTNLVCPVHGTLLGGLEMAKVPFDKYIKWVMPLVLIILAYCYIGLYFMGTAGWTGL